jgi:hypothetical protein
MVTVKYQDYVHQKQHNKQKYVWQNYGIWEKNMVSSKIITDIQCKFYTKLVMTMELE